jgi:hypothetical protein
MEGSGFLSGGRTRYNQGVVVKTWLNLSRVQVWEVEWPDGQTGQLSLEDCCQYGEVFYCTRNIHPDP